MHGHDLSIHGVETFIFRPPGWGLGMSVTDLRTVSSQQNGERQAVAALPAPTTAQRLRYGFKISLREPTTLIGILAALLFAYLILVPIVSMLMDAGRVQFGDERRTHMDLGALTL